jgi:uncharacterized OB-fold protein
MYKSSGPFYSEKEGRVRINLLHRNKTLNRNITYARYLISVKQGKEPPKGFEVDHLDGDRTNDTISNLQVLSKEDNRVKREKDIAVLANRKIYIIQCSSCGVFFERPARKFHKNCKKHFCSNTCKKTGSSLNSSYSNTPILKEISFQYKKVSEPWVSVSVNIPEDLIEQGLFYRKEEVTHLCKKCGNPFVPKTRWSKYCSSECIKGNNQKVSIETKKESILKVLAGNSTWEEQGRLLGISGSALRKWAKENDFLK